MRGIFLTIFRLLVLFNICTLILDLKNFGFDWDINLILKIHYEISIYGLKCSPLVILVNKITKDWFIRKGDKIIWVGPGIEKEKKERRKNYEDNGDKK